MIVFTSLKDIHIPENTAVTVGKFDGIHQGHAALLGEICKKETPELKSVVVSFTFEVEGKSPNPAIFSQKEKKELLNRAGVDYYINIPFTEDLAHTSAGSFLEDFLIGRLHMKKFVCGRDFCFGFERKGNSEYLAARSSELHFELRVISDLTGGTEKISSNHIRDLIRQGKVKEAGVYLSRPYVISGEVIHGRALGRKLGFPTLNIVPPAGKIIPRYGVYHVVTEIDGKMIPGIGNIGLKPTISEEKQLLLEVHLLHFSGDLYGKTVSAYFLDFIRPEKKFDSIGALKEQVLSDIRFVEESEEKGNFHD